MGWIKRAHKCPVPRLDEASKGDVWECEECRKRWCMVGADYGGWWPINA
jgi:hypothetical protein